MYNKNVSIVAAIIVAVVSFSSCTSLRHSGETCPQAYGHYHNPGKNVKPFNKY